MVDYDQCTLGGMVVASDYLGDHFLRGGVAILMIISYQIIHRHLCAKIFVEVNLKTTHEISLTSAHTPPQTPDQS